MFHVFAVHVTKGLNPRITVYYILHICWEKVNRAKKKVCLLLHILLTSQLFRNRKCKNVLYIALS